MPPPSLNYKYMYQSGCTATQQCLLFIANLDKEWIYCFYFQSMNKPPGIYGLKAHLVPWRSIVRSYIWHYLCPSGKHFCSCWSQVPRGNTSHYVSFPTHSDYFPWGLLGSYKAGTAPKFSTVFFAANMHVTVPASLSPSFLILSVGVRRKESKPKGSVLHGVHKGEKRTEKERQK